jgi:hypothetical protein
VRRLIEAFVEAVQENVPDETTRERIRQAILGALPQEPVDGAGEREDPLVQ